MDVKTLVIWTSKVWSFGRQKFGHLDVQSDVISTSKVWSWGRKNPCVKRPQHLKYDVVLVIIDVPMTTVGRPLVSRVVSVLTNRSINRKLPKLKSGNEIKFFKLYIICNKLYIVNDKLTFCAIVCRVSREMRKFCVDLFCKKKQIF